MKKLSIFSLALLVLFTLNSIASAQGDVRRRTVAITYLRDPVTVILGGTTLRPQARGEATVERWRKRNETEIDITIENMIPAFNYGADYTTYVLWAITPAGQVDNLGEFRLSGGSARLKAATPHQTFAMIVTAEPHYLVKLPSRMVILENLVPMSKNVQVQSSEVFFTGDSGRFYTDTSVPQLAERDYNKTPMELLQARRAVQIARLADGERYAPSDYNSAVSSLEQAEQAHRAGKSVHEVGRIAREAITFAVRARDISEEKALAAERRNEIARRDAEIRRVSDTASDLSEKLSDAESRYKASELARQNVQNQLDRALNDLTDAKAENRTLRSENDRLRDEVDRLRQDLTAARGRISDLEARTSAATNELNATRERAEAMERAERARVEAEARRRDFAELQSAIAGIVTVKPNASGFVAVLPDNFFLPNKTDLSSRIKLKIDALARAIAAHPSAVFTVEGHSDARANAEEFARARAEAVANYLAAMGVPSANIKVESRGATVPLSTKKTIAARAMNRRVELVFVAPN
ncbi:MAG TPA: OmpA family protein [Blastocatellia bacterium]|nr:OmpA family protein [Blastocatellia bacterium]